ncbi:hypothetical protein DMUE_0231 [Dictyocoela muelleri]|nr:hypothetical protein DMUE_0231 [Dictyocoela muelleri]
MIFKYSPFDIFKRNLQNQISKAKEKEIANSLNENLIRNKKRIKHRYKIGDLVFKKTTNPDKIEDKWHGPFKIEKIINENMFLIDKIKRSTYQNIKNIRPYFREGEDVVTNDM